MKPPEEDKPGVADELRARLQVGAFMDEEVIESVATPPKPKPKPSDAQNSGASPASKMVPVMPLSQDQLDRVLKKRREKAERKAARESGESQQQPGGAPSAVAPSPAAVIASIPLLATGDAQQPSAIERAASMGQALVTEEPEEPEPVLSPKLGGADENDGFYPVLEGAAPAEAPSSSEHEATIGKLAPAPAALLALVSEHAAAAALQRSATAGVVRREENLAEEAEIYAKAQRDMQKRMEEAASTTTSIGGGEDVCAALYKCFGGKL